MGTTGSTVTCGVPIACVPKLGGSIDGVGGGLLTTATSDFGVENFGSGSLTLAVTTGVLSIFEAKFNAVPAPLGLTGNADATHWVTTLAVVLIVSVQIVTSPQSHLRKARRSSVHKKNSKLLDPHSPIKYRPTSTAPVPCAAANGGLLIMAAEKAQFSCVFAREFRVNPKFDLEPVYVIRKGISR